MHPGRRAPAQARSLLASLSRILLLAVMLQAPARAAPPETDARPGDLSVAVLCYHRFGPVVADSMTTRTSVFDAQLTWLQQNGAHIIPLRALVDYLAGSGPAPAPRSVVITVDDGHHTVFSEMLPVIERHDVPVTLFIYPSAISNASYALTWDQLRTLRANKNVDVQSHTYWHPNFDRERKRLSAAEFAAFADNQLRRSKSRLEQEVPGPIDLLAWPFGISGQDVQMQARQAGYTAAFSIVRRRAAKGDDMLALPRFLMSDQDGTGALRAIVGAQ